jgi:hypothetical protein
MSTDKIIGTTERLINDLYARTDQLVQATQMLAELHISQTQSLFSAIVSLCNVVLDAGLTTRNELADRLESSATLPSGKGPPEDLVMLAQGIREAKPLVAPAPMHLKIIEGGKANLLR